MTEKEWEIWMDVGPGWQTFVKPLCEEIQKHAFILQVKEKFGTLRVYTSPISDDLDEKIRAAEKLSAVTCEECGAPGTLRTDGWLKTRCDDCHGR